jgi:hypothetical protein
MIPFLQNTMTGAVFCMLMLVNESGFFDKLYTLKDVMAKLF